MSSTITPVSGTFATPNDLAGWNQFLQQLQTTLNAVQAAATAAALFSKQARGNPWFGTPTGTRALSTVYQNLTGKPILVSVSVLFPINLFVQIIADTDASNPPTTSVDVIAVQQATLTSGSYSVHFLVLPNNFYKVQDVNANSGGVNTWTEWN